MSTQYILPTHVFQRGFAEESVLLDMQTGDYFSLNASGAWMLGALLEGQSEAQVATLAAVHFDVDLAQVVSDLRGLIVEMCARGLLLSSGPP